METDVKELSEEKTAHLLRNDRSRSLVPPVVDLKEIRDTFKTKFMEYFDKECANVTDIAEGGKPPGIKGKPLKIYKALDKFNSLFTAAAAISAVAAIPSGLAAPILGAFSAGTGLLAVLASSGAAIAGSVGMARGQLIADRNANMLKSSHIKMLVAKELAKNLAILFEYQLSQLTEDVTQIGRMARGAVNRLYKALEKGDSEFCSLKLLLAITGNDIPQSHDRHADGNLLYVNEYLQKYIANKCANEHWNIDNLYFKSGTFLDQGDVLIFKTKAKNDKKISHTNKYGFRHEFGSQLDNGYDEVDQNRDCLHQMFFTQKLHSVFIKVDDIMEYCESSNKSGSTEISDYLAKKYANKELIRPLNIVGRELNFSPLNEIKELYLTKVDLCYANFTGVKLINAQRS
jgi:hypothetical protein